MTKVWYMPRIVRSLFCRRCRRWYGAHSDELQEASSDVGREHGIRGRLVSLFVLTEYHKRGHPDDFIRFKKESRGPSRQADPVTSQEQADIPKGSQP